MPRLGRSPKPKFRADQIVAAYTDFAADDVPGGVCKRGTELRGHDPIVLAHEPLFISADTPNSEWPSIYTGLKTEEPDHSNPRVKILERAPDTELMEAVCDLAYPNGVTIRKGDQYHRDHPMVKTGGEYWRPVEEVESSA